MEWLICLRGGNAKVERLLIKFTKNKGTKFISHLDTLRTLHRAFRRAELPISYSKGFNPHASISVASPLSLGIESIAEYADVELDNEVDTDFVVKALNDALPSDIKIVKVVQVKGKMQASMAAVASSKYSIRFKKQTSVQVVEDIINKILQALEIMKMKKTKSGEKLINIRTFIKDISYEKFENEGIKFECILQSGSNGSLGAQAISDLIKEYSNGEIYGHPYIIREEIYTYVGDRRVPLDLYFSGK